MTSAPCAGFVWFRLFRVRAWHRWAWMGVGHGSLFVVCGQCGEMRRYL